MIRDENTSTVSKLWKFCTDSMNRTSIYTEVSCSIHIGQYMCYLCPCVLMHSPCIVGQCCMVEIDFQYISMHDVLCLLQCGEGGNVIIKLSMHACRYYGFK